MLAYRHVRSCLPRRGATSHVHSRWGPGRQGHEGKNVSYPLPTIQCLAKEMCARRGFDIETHGSLPSSGTILSIDELTFDRAIVLLSLFQNARAYADRAFEATEGCVNALSLRVSSCIANRSALETVVSEGVDPAVLAAVLMEDAAGRAAEENLLVHGVPSFRECRGLVSSCLFQ